jgi:cytoskeletal protein CcmA (bactofilin family)
MAITPGFFNKREPEASNPRHITSTHNATSYGPTGTPVTQPATTAAPTPAAGSDAGTVPEGGSKLTVGPNIKLKGVEITDCDTLVVEGLVEATMDSRVIQISERGAFKGSAEIDIAEIHGQFDGTLTVRQKLTIYSTGKVSGKIRYGKVVIEEGGQLTGEIMFGAITALKSGAHDKPVLSVANGA